MTNLIQPIPLISIVLTLLCLSAQVINGKNNGNPPNNSQKPTLEQVCEKICHGSHPCPPECYDILDPWAMDVDMDKRSSGIDGFTFEDYLFLRWLGRDMSRHRLQK